MRAETPRLLRPLRMRPPKSVFAEKRARVSRHFLNNITMLFARYQLTCCVAVLIGTSSVCGGVPPISGDVDDGGVTSVGGDSSAVVLRCGNASSPSLSNCDDDASPSRGRRSRTRCSIFIIAASRYGRLTIVFTCKKSGSALLKEKLKQKKKPVDSLERTHRDFDV